MDKKNRSNEKIWYLNQINFFKCLPKDEMERLNRVTIMKEFETNQVLYLQEEPGEHVYLLKRGLVKITKTLYDGNELILSFIKPGEIFGEFAVFDQESRHTQAIAYNPILICILKRQDLIDMIRTNPELGLHLTKIIGFRRRVIENRLENLVFRSVTEKLAALLLELKGQFGKDTDSGILVDIPLTHKDLANLIGASRTTVSENMSNFMAQGIIGKSGRRIIINNSNHLQNLLIS
jgi:CRP-like cAMP-binding protein